MTRASHHVAVVFALVAIGGVHCAPKDVVIADIPQDGGDDGDHPPHHSMPCTGAADCRESDFCDKHTCDDALGECHPRPFLCDPTPLFVCGCDDVSYWNDCLRKTAGVSASAAGECVAGATCDGPNSEVCPGSGASCAHLFPGGAEGPCPPDAPDAPGRCWGLPPICPMIPDDAPWGPCADAQGACTDACSAIRAGAPYRRLPGPTCPP